MKSSERQSMYEKHLCLGSREFLFTFTGQDVYNVRDSGVPDSMIYKNRTYSFPDMHD